MQKNIQPTIEDELDLLAATLAGKANNYKVIDGQMQKVLMPLEQWCACKQRQKADAELLRKKLFK